MGARRIFEVQGLNFYGLRAKKIRARGPGELTAGVPDHPRRGTINILLVRPVRAELRARKVRA